MKGYLKNRVLIADGAMGTYYAKLKQDDSVMSEWANISEPEIIKGIHKEYIEAGAGLIRTNTFAANRFSQNCTKEERDMMIEKACSIAKEAVQD